MARFCSGGVSPPSAQGARGDQILPMRGQLRCYFRRPAASAPSADMREGNPVMKLRKVLRSTVIALAAAGLAVGGGQAANATPAPKLSGELAQLWTTILETPSAE